MAILTSGICLPLHREVTSSRLCKQCSREGRREGGDHQTDRAKEGITREKERRWKLKKSDIQISTEDGSREDTAEEESGSLGLAQCKLVYAG